MTEHDAPTTADLDDLARKLDAFGRELAPSQQAVLRDLLAKAAAEPAEPDEVAGFTVHAENQSAFTRHDAPRPVHMNSFSVMGVHLFYY